VPPATGAAKSRPGRGRRILVWVLIVVASIVTLLSILTLYVNRQMLDRDAWRKASEDLIADPQIRSALSIYTVNQLYDSIDVAAAIQSRLPNNLQGLAGPVAGALRQPATDAMNILLARPRIQQLFVNASSVAHDKLINVLENKTGLGISTGNGVVTLDLHEMVREIGTSLGIPAAALDKLPQKAGVVEVMRSDQLNALQQIVRLIKALSVWFVITVLALYALAIYLARGLRRETLRNAGWSFVIVGLIVLIIRRYVGNYAVDALSQPTFEGAVRHTWLIGSSILGQIGRAVVFYGAVAVLGAVLAGPTRAATATRRWFAPVLNFRQGVAWGTVAGVYLLLVLWGPTHALREWWGILLFAGLLALGVWMLRRQTLQEFPTAPVAEAADGRPGGASGLAVGTIFRGGARTKENPADELAKLNELRASGAISEEEYERAKALVLS
jgi:hypothetical protein